MEVQRLAMNVVLVLVVAVAMLLVTYAVVRVAASAGMLSTAAAEQRRPRPPSRAGLLWVIGLRVAGIVVLGHWAVFDSQSGVPGRVLLAVVITAGYVGVEAYLWRRREGDLYRELSRH